MICPFSLMRHERRPLLRYRPRKLGKLGVPGKPIPAKMEESAFQATSTGIRFYGG
jgi:hypothetical protein